MNFDLERIVEEIVEDNELSQEFSRLDEMDDIYNYCKDMGLDCDEKEFDDGISEYINVLNEDIYQDEIFEEKLSNIGGGVNLKNVFSKSVASVLSVLAIGSSVELGAVGVADNLSVANNPKTSVSFSEKMLKEWPKTKEALHKFYQKHKKLIRGVTAVTVGAIVLVGGTVLIKHRRNNSRVEKVEEKKGAKVVDKKAEEEVKVKNKFEALCEKWYENPNEENLKAIKDFVNGHKDQNFQIECRDILLQDRGLKEVMENPTAKRWYAVSNSVLYNGKIRARAKAMGDLIELQDAGPHWLVGWIKSNKETIREAYKKAKISVSEAEKLGINDLREPLNELRKKLKLPE